MNREAGRYTIDYKSSTDAGNTVLLVPRFMGKSLPKQILRLRGYRVRFGGTGADAAAVSADALANALNAGVLFIDIRDSSGTSIFSEDHLIDSVPGRLYFSISLDANYVTNRDSLNKVCYLKTDLPDTLFISVYTKTESDNAPIMALAVSIKELYLDFETETGSEYNVKR